MNKIINPCMCEVYSNDGKKQMSNVFVEIEFNEVNGELTMSGVIGPMANGECKGGCGQCQEEIRKGKPTKNWTFEMLEKLCDIWDKWHLNTMHADCEHQWADEEFQKQKSEKVIVYKWLHLKDELKKEKEEVSKYIKKELLENGTVTLTERQQFLYSLDDCLYRHVGDYDKNIYKHDEKDVYYQTLNWIRPDQHEKGLLSKPCPVCGYKYGHGWTKIEVSQDVINWLFNLPETEIEPAWV